MADFLMPSLGADMDEGTVVEWLVGPGDTVHRGDVVAVVDTSKSAIEVEVFVDGRVDELLVPVGSTVPVGTPLARLSDVGSSGDRAAFSAPAVTPPAVAVPAGAAPAVASPVVRHLAHERGLDLGGLRGSGPGGAVTREDLDQAAPRPSQALAERGRARPTGAAPVTPRARRRAEELGVDLARVVGTGPGGAVQARDVEAVAEGGAAEPPAAAPEPAERAAPRGKTERAAAMRAAIAALMARSKREIPHYYLQSTVDLARAMEWLGDNNSGRPPATRMLPAALLLKAAALAARRYPDLNGFFVDGAFEPSEHVHLGVAVSLRGGGLIAPAIHDADTLDLDALMAALKDLVARARSGRLRGSQMSDPTITVTNLGDQGAELVHGVIYPPQVALVGYGRIVDRPWAVGGMLAVRPTVTVTLAGDHRVTDGHRGGQFLAAVDAALQEPEEL